MTLPGDAGFVGEADLEPRKKKKVLSGWKYWSSYDLNDTIKLRLLMLGYVLEIERRTSYTIKASVMKND